MVFPLTGFRGPTPGEPHFHLWTAHLYHARCAACTLHAPEGYLSPFEPCWLVHGRHLCDMCYQFHRTHDRVRRLSRRSQAYGHAIQSLELVEAHAGNWGQFTSQGSHLFEPSPPPPPPPVEPPAASAQLSVVEREDGSIVAGEPEGVDEELSPVTTPTASGYDSIPNAQPESDSNVHPGPEPLGHMH